MVLVSSIKNVFFKSKLPFSRQNIRDTAKILRKNILYFKEIYQFSGGHFFIGVIFLVYQWKMLLKIKKTIRESIYRQNGSSQEDIQIYFRTLFDRTGSFRFNCKKRYQKWIILFCTKSMRDTKKMIGKKIVRLKNIYKLACKYFFIRVIYFHLFIKNVFIRIKNLILPPKYTRYGKTIWKCMINSEATFFFLIIQFILASRWEFSSVN